MRASDLILGAYINTHSPVHNFDARLKMLLLLVYSIALFFIESWQGMGLMALGVFVIWGLSKIPCRVLRTGLIPASIILFFILAANGLTIENPDIALIYTFGITYAGISKGLFYVARIVLLIIGSLILTSTTTSAELMDALSSLMKPLRKFNIPVDDIATMAQIALRFIPQTATEIQNIVNAQRARGAKFNEGGLIARLKVWIPVLIPLIVSLFKRAENLGLAMTARCYTGKGRTQISKSDITFREALLMMLLLLVIISTAIAL